MPYGFLCNGTNPSAKSSVVDTSIASVRDALNVVEPGFLG